MVVRFSAIPGQIPDDGGNFHEENTIAVPITQAIIATTEGSRYIQRLAKHWSHRFAVSLEADQGTIDFGDDKTVRLQATPSTLEVLVSSIDGSLLDNLEEVVASHLQRFASKESLNFEWSRREVFS